MSGEQHDNDSGKTPGSPIAGRTAGPPPSKRGLGRHGSPTTNRDLAAELADGQKEPTSPAPELTPPVADSPSPGATIGAVADSDVSRFQTRVFEPSALKGSLGVSAATPGVGENPQQKPARFQTMAFESDELPREWQDLRILNRPAADAESASPPPPPQRTGTQMMGAVVSPPPSAGDATGSAAVKHQATFAAEPTSNREFRRDTNHPVGSKVNLDNAKVPIAPKQHTQLFKPGELFPDTEFESDQALTEHPSVVAGPSVVTNTYDAMIAADNSNEAAEVPRYPTVSIDRTQMLMAVTEPHVSGSSNIHAPESAQVINDGPIADAASFQRSGPSTMTAKSASTEPSTSSLRVAKRAPLPDLRSEDRLEPVFVTVAEENDPTSMVLAPPPDDPSFHRASTVVRDVPTSKPAAPRAFSERETMLNIPVVRAETESNEPNRGTPKDHPSNSSNSGSKSQQPIAASSINNSNEQYHKPESHQVETEPAWVSGNAPATVERERQRHAEGRSMFAPPSKKESTPLVHSALTPVLRFYGVVSLLLLIGSLAIPTMAGDQLVAPWSGLMELVGPAFTATLFGLLTLIWLAIPAPPVVRSSVLLLTGLGCLVLSSMNIQDSVLRLVFHGHPGVTLIFAEMGFVTALFWCALIVYPSGLFARKHAPSGKLPLVTALIGMVILATILVILGTFVNSESPIVQMVSVLNTESSPRGDRLASILVLSTAGISVFGFMSFATRRLAGLATVWGGLFLTVATATLVTVATHVSQHIGGTLEPLKLVLVSVGGVVITTAGLGGLVSLLSTRNKA